MGSTTAEHSPEVWVHWLSLAFGKFKINEVPLRAACVHTQFSALPHTHTSDKSHQKTGSRGCHEGRQAGDDGHSFGSDVDLCGTRNLSENKPGNSRLQSLRSYMQSLEDMKTDVTNIDFACQALKPQIEKDCAYSCFL